MFNGYLSLFHFGLAAHRPTSPDLTAVAPGTGVLHYATDTKVLSAYVGGAWVIISQASGPVIAPVTVANLPANPSSGQFAVVSDATTPALGATVVGAGAVQVAVIWNGAAWKVA